MSEKNERLKSRSSSASSAKSQSSNSPVADKKLTANASKRQDKSKKVENDKKKTTKKSDHLSEESITTDRPNFFEEEEFEEFPIQKAKSSEQIENVGVWQDNWEDETNEADFHVSLEQELKKLADSSKI
ncbi:putative 26S proteasome complex subunit dss-1 [Aphelenchoides besseyi]|nr:putative 26S proteasome complex subunit dss-1 [Aphelenchoides besseyi]KAI6178100.1 putative 26S proteasome complex subunit dss-1 [Aphelenchoides besseyi]KAI6207528.1 putative 26S proteasome complex subunit dss-1 [Aphelenchoides besseyi]